MHSADTLKLMSSALDMVREGMLMVDTDGLIQGANQAVLEILGGSEEYTKGRSVRVKNARICLNAVFVKPYTPLKEGDEITFLPMMTGG